jgi:hypothetical protein
MRFFAAVFGRYQSFQLLDSCFSFGKAAEEM